MKIILFSSFLAIFLVSCSSKSRNPEEAALEYENRENMNQIKAMERTDLMSRIGAVKAQIGELNQEIQNQKDLISDYSEDKDTVPSARMMIDNARARIKNLERERKALLEFKNGMEIDLLHVNAPQSE